jgi:hypothetical protein
MINGADPKAPVYIPYMNLGSLNTRKDVHALNRDELVQSVNCWPAYDQSLSKRPGNTYFVTANGATGSGAAGKALCSCRFADVTYNLVLSGSTVYAAKATDTSFTPIGTVSSNATYITAAQMFDPTTAAVNGGDGIVFVCDGNSTPQYWKGPGNMLATVATGANNLPARADLITPIQPQFCKTLGNNSHLFYSGDATMPSAVFISNPFNPQQFTSTSMISNPYGYASGAYFPAIIGNNDGVEGGRITGMESLGGAMLIFKEAAIYSMYQTTLLGDIPVWQVQQVSNSVGCLSPRSIVRFDTFIAFLSLDGVYITDGSAVTKISGDVPTIFDSSWSGNAALITNRTTAIGVRFSQKLLIFFASNGSSYNNAGVWFAFDRQASSGNPSCGQINGMNVGGAALQNGPNDMGLVVWCDGSTDKVSTFGSGFSDWGSNIQSNFATKGDMMDDVFGPDSAICVKQAQDVFLLVQLLGVNSQPNVNFTGIVIADLLQAYTQALSQGLLPPPTGGTWGVGTWGNLIWGSSATNAQYYVLKIPAQSLAQGRILQFAIQESSQVPWIIMGLLAYVNKQEVGF